MKRRLLNAAALVSLLLCTTTVVFWIRSYWAADVLMVEWVRSNFHFRSNAGTLQMFHGGLDDLRLIDPHFSAISRPPRPLVEYPSTFFRIHTYRYGVTEWSFPHWAAALLTVILPVVWMRRRRVSSVGFCPACGYDLRGTRGSECPECGTRTAAAT